MPDRQQDLRTAPVQEDQKVCGLYLLPLVLFPSVFFLNNSLLPQPAYLQHFLGYFVTFYCQPSSPSRKPQTLSCLHAELQAKPNVNNHSMRCERRIQNTPYPSQCPASSLRGLPPAVSVLGLLRWASRGQPGHPPRDGERSRGVQSPAADQKAEGENWK